MTLEEKSSKRRARNRAPNQGDCESNHGRTTMASPEQVPRAVSPLCVEPEITANDDGLSAFISVRPRLFGIAYRMLGSAAEAEDVVQDVWMRWQSTNRNAIVNPAAYLATTTTRLCINLA